MECVVDDGWLPFLCDGKYMALVLSVVIIDDEFHLPLSYPLFQDVQILLQLKGVRLDADLMVKDGEQLYQSLGVCNPSCVCRGYL